MNIRRAILDNVPQAMSDLVNERLELIKRIRMINQELTDLQCLLDLTEEK